MPKVLDTNGMGSSLVSLPTALSFLLSQSRTLAALCDSMGQTVQGASFPATWQPAQVLELRPPPDSHRTLKRAAWAMLSGRPVTGAKHPKGWEKKQSKGKQSRLSKRQF